MKPGLFSFIGNEFENIFSYSDLFLPGIEKLVGLYFTPIDKQLHIISRNKNGEMETDPSEILDNRENQIMIQKFRSVTQPYSWIRKEELPFEFHDSQKKIVPDLFTEFENVILIIRLPNETDLLQDLLLIYFNHNLGNFGLNKADKLLTADNKIIIGHVLYYQFKSFLEINIANRKLLHRLNNSVRSIIHENMTLKDQLAQVQANYGENVINIAQQHLIELSRSCCRNYILTEDAIMKLKEYKGNLKNLRIILENAVIFTENLILAAEDGTVGIQSYSLDFDSFQVVEKADRFTRKIDSRQTRALLLLDRLERAANILKSKNLPIISSNVGKSMEPPISAPAITDALNKNRNIIRQITEKYPNKWETIRTEFKPLLNQLRRREPESGVIESLSS